MENLLEDGGPDTQEDQQAINHLIHNFTVARYLNRYFSDGGTDIPYGGHSQGPDDDRITV